MADKKTSSAGAIESLNELRRAVSAPTPSRLEKYTKKAIEEKSNATTYPSADIYENSMDIEVQEIETTAIIRWKYKDRPDNELGDIESLAESIRVIGQQQPCIVRPSLEIQGKYELIAGERRWRAAESIGTKLKVIIQNIDDRLAALIQAAENENRLDLSEFAKGMSFSDKIENGIISQKDLINILGISQQQVTRLLSYKRIPQDLFNAIGDFKKVSSRTAEELARQANKGEAYLNALIELAPKIKAGKCGHNSIVKEINKILSERTSTIANLKVFNNDGRHLFTWRRDNNADPSIHFPKDIIKLLSEQIISIDELTQDLKESIARKLSIL